MTDHNADSSPPKRTRKAGTRRRCITSLTIDGPSPTELITNRTPFSIAEQHEVIERLFKGGSPKGACDALQLDVARYWITLEYDIGFVEAVDTVFKTLDYNVIAMLYRAAMNGSVDAQKFWLRCRGPMGWLRPVEAEEVSYNRNLNHGELNAMEEREAAAEQADDAAKPAAEPSGTASGGVPAAGATGGATIE